MKTTKYRQYKIELVNGRGGVLSIPFDDYLQFIIDTNKFINDPYSGAFIRSKAIVKFEYIGIKEE